MSAIVVLAVVAPLAGAAVSALWRRRGVQRVVSLTVAGGEVVVGAALVASSPDIHVAALAGWPERFAIVLVGDPLAALLVAVTGIIAAAVLVSAGAGDDDSHPLFHPLLLVLVAGTCGVFLVGDLFNLFVWLEVTLISSYVLAALHGSARQVRAATVYVSTSLLASLLALTGVALTYAAAGSVNFAVLASAPPRQAETLTVAATLLFVAFGVKAALLPLGGWLPVTYPAAPPAVSALFAGLLTTLGVIVLYRLATIVYPGAGGLLPALLLTACTTAVVAALAAAGQRDLAPALAFIVMTQVGIMVVGVGLTSAAALTAGLFFVVQDVVAKTAIYLAASTLGDVPGSGRPAAVGSQRPWLAAAFVVAGLSLAGIPPTAGFVGKALLLSAALSADRWAVVTAVLAASLLVAVALLGVWHGRSADDSWQPTSAGRGVVRGIGRTGPPALLAGVVLGVGLVPAGLYTLAERAAAVLADRTAYIEAVLS